MNPKGWYKQQIGWAPFTGNDTTYGDKTFGTTVTILARVEPKYHMVRGLQGDALASHVIYTDQTIGLFDRVWLPGVPSSDNTLARVPITVEQVVDKSGAVKFVEVHV